MKKELSESAKADLLLVTAIKETKSERAYSELFKKYHKAMEYHFKGFLKDEEDVKDLISEAFMKLTTNINKFDEETAVFSTWFFKMTENIFIDSLRKKKGDVVSLSDLATVDGENHSIEYSIASTDDTPEEDIIRKETCARIRKSLDSLKNPEIAEVIKMRYFDGMSYREIGAVTGKPEGTIKAFIFRGKAMLKEHIESKGL